MASSTLRATGGRNRAGEVIVVSTILFDPPVDDGYRTYAVETAVFRCGPTGDDAHLAVIAKRGHEWMADFMAGVEHERILKRALR